jgi:hypothetical protein
MAEEIKTDEKTTEKKAAARSATTFAMPKISFSTFIMSLNASILVSLGLETDPISGEKAVNLPLARQTIDILGMLEQKTKGNLEDDERRLLTHMLYELRILYIKAKEKPEEQC